MQSAPVGGPSPRGGEAARLVASLGSAERARAEEARARLTALGARAVPALLASLDGSCPVARESALEILSLIRDPRGREPIVAQLHDRDPRLRQAAAAALAAFPVAASVPPLARLLARDASLEVRCAAVRGLIELFSAGCEEAIRSVLGALFDPAADPALRAAASGVIAHLQPREREEVLARLGERPGAALPAREPAEVRKALADLASPLPERWKTALNALTHLGHEVIAPLVDEMVWRSQDAVYCARGAMVLRGLGPRRLRGVAEHLERVEDPLPLEALVDAAGALDDKPLIYRLRGLIQRLRPRLSAPPDLSASRRPDDLERVIAKSHLLLARTGSRVAIDDLRDALRSPDRSLSAEILAAVEMIGTKDEIPDLVAAWLREDEREEAGAPGADREVFRDRLRGVARTIMKRDRIRSTNRLFAALPPPERRAFERMHGVPRRPAARGRARSTR